MKPKKDFKLFLAIGDPLSTWTLCLEHEGTVLVGWANGSIGYAPEAIRMECDLDNPVTEQAEGQGLCSWEEE